jgi:hypothetical protein
MVVEWLLILGLRTLLRFAPHLVILHLLLLNLGLMFLIVLLISLTSIHLLTTICIVFSLLHIQVKFINAPQTSFRRMLLQILIIMILLLDLEVSLWLLSHLTLWLFLHLGLLTNTRTLSFFIPSCSNITLGTQVWSDTLALPKIFPISSYLTYLSLLGYLLFFCLYRLPNRG